MDSKNKQQTAVEWLFENMPEDYVASIPYELADQALQKEREQIINAVHYGIRTPYTNIQTIHPQIEMTKGEQYYNDNYGK